MRAIKKINNNIAICIDGNGNEVVVFGKGVGFHEMPYEIKDLSLIERTFYGISSQHFGLLKEISKEVFEATSVIVEYASLHINANLNPNLIFTLADHINFAIDRYRRNINVKTPYVGDIKNLYENEYHIGEKAVLYINKKFGIHLRKDEAISIALHLINAERFDDIKQGQLDDEKIIDSIIDIIEKQMNIKINRNGVNCARFITHLKYLIKRLTDDVSSSSENKMMFETMKDNYPEVYKCACNACKYLNTITNKTLNDEEIMYLMLHINRVCSREKI